MRRELFPLVGTPFTGLMIANNGPEYLEYNVRTGVPEAQTLLPLISKDTDLGDIMVACTEGQVERLIRYNRRKIQGHGFGSRRWVSWSLSKNNSHGILSCRYGYLPCQHDYQ